MIAVFASGAGSNVASLAAAFPGRIAAVVTNVENAGVLTVAAERGIGARAIDHRDFASREAHEAVMLEALSSLVRNTGYAGGLRVLVLAGYMRVLTPAFLSGFAETFPGARIINLHPAHLDQYRGAHAYEHAVARLYPRWGLSVHAVTEILDGGELIASDELPVLPWDSPSDLHARARPREHALLVAAVAAVAAVAGPTGFSGNTPPQKKTKEQDHGQDV